MREKNQLKDFLRHQASATNAVANSKPGVGKAEIMIEGLRFHVADGGKKLVKSSGKRYIWYQHIRLPNTTNGLASSSFLFSVYRSAFCHSEDGCHRRCQISSNENW